MAYATGGGGGELLLLSPEAAGKEKLPPRVLPLLCADLKTKFGMHQHMHLLVFKDRWKDVLKVKVTQEDARELLLILFVFMNGRVRDTLGEVAQRHIEECGRVSFDILHEVLCTHHTHAAVFLQAIEGIMRDLQMTNDHAEVRGPPMEHLGDYQALRRELKKLNRVEKLKTRKRRRMELSTLTAGIDEVLKALADGKPSEPIDMDNLTLLSIDVEAACLIENASPDSDAVRLYLSTLEGFPQAQRCETHQKRIDEVLKHLSWEDEMDYKEDPSVHIEAMKVPDSPDAGDAAPADGGDDGAKGGTEESADGGGPGKAEDEGTPAEAVDGAAAEEPQRAADVPPATPAKDPARKESHTPQARGADGERAPSHDNPEVRRIALQPPVSEYFPTTVGPEDLCLDRFLVEPSQRVFAIQILKTLDYAGVGVRFFLKQPNTAHLYLPHLFSSKTKVYRDFVTCTQRPKSTNKWGPAQYIHIKTNIRIKSDIMYRFVVEGYNYGTNGIIHSDIVGYAHRKWTKLGKGVMVESGWPEGWDNDMSYDYMNGCTIDQYYSSDGYVVIRLQSRSFFCVGFSVSAWLVVHDFGAGFHLTSTVHHQDKDL